VKRQSLDGGKGDCPFTWVNVCGIFEFDLEFKDKFNISNGSGSDNGWAQVSSNQRRFLSVNVLVENDVIQRACGKFGAVWRLRMSGLAPLDQ